MLYKNNESYADGNREKKHLGL